MVFYTRAAFSKFAMVHTDVFPYNSVRQTRRMYHPQWLLLKSNYSTGAVYSRPRSIYPVPSTAFDKQSVQSLIMSKSAFPVPADYDDIVAVMEWWGRGISGTWQQSVFNMLYESLKRNTPMRKREAMYECLRLLYDEKMDFQALHTHIGYQVRDKAIDDFREHYIYMYENYTSSNYHWLAMMSIYYMDQRLPLLEQETEAAATTTTTTPDPPRSMPNIVPCSPDRACSSS